jgi:hypothetical protein
MVERGVGFYRYTDNGQGKKCFALAKIHVEVTPNLLGALK